MSKTQIVAGLDVGTTKICARPVGGRRVGPLTQAGGGRRRSPIKTKGWA